MRQEIMGFWDAEEQLDHMQTICTSLQTDNHNNTSLLNFYRPDALPDAQTTVLKHSRHSTATASGSLLLPLPVLPLLLNDEQHTQRLGCVEISDRVPTTPGKSWNCVCKISRNWNLIDNDADATMQAAGAKKTSELLPAVTCIYGTSCVNNCKVFEELRCYFFTTRESDEHIFHYGCCYHTINIWLVTAVCLYIGL